MIQESRFALITLHSSFMNAGAGITANQRSTCFIARS